MELVDELEEEALVLQGDVLDAETTFLFALADFVPRNETSGSPALIFSSPEEGSTTLIQSLNDTLWKETHGHEVGGVPVQHRVEEDEAVTRREQGCLPTGKVSVSLGDERREGSEIEFDIGQG